LYLTNSKTYNINVKEMLNMQEKMYRGKLERR